MMSSAKAELVPDTAGNTMELISTKSGQYIATDMVLETVDSLPLLPLREDDILLCSYPKSGCHWLWETIRYLILGDSNPASKVDKEAYMIELNTMEDLGALESPRILNNHRFFTDQPADLLGKGVKVVFVFRNIKDVAVSYYHHHTRDNTYKYKATFSEYLQRFVPGLVDSGSVFEYLQDWEKGIKANPSLKVHILSYEDMTANPIQELKRLNEFLCTSRNDEFLQTVSQKTSLKAMRQTKGNVTAFKDDSGSPIMYRKGKVGDWQNHFSDPEAQTMDETITRRLGNITLFPFIDRLESSAEAAEDH